MYLQELGLNPIQDKSENDIKFLKYVSERTYAKCGTLVRQNT